MKHFSEPRKKSENIHLIRSLMSARTLYCVVFIVWSRIQPCDCPYGIDFIVELIIDAFDISKSYDDMLLTLIPIFFFDCITKISIFTTVKFYQGDGWVGSQSYVWSGKFCGQVGNVTWNINEMSVLHWLVFVSWFLW